MSGGLYLVGNATELGAAVDVLMPAMVDGPFRSGDAAGVVAGVYLLSASLNTAPVQYSGNLASLLGTYSDVLGRKLLQEEAGAYTCPLSAQRKHTLCDTVGA
jgi:hypothetical protein